MLLFFYLQDLKNKNSLFIYLKRTVPLPHSVILIIYNRQIFTGWQEYNIEVKDLGGEAMRLNTYLLSGQIFQTIFQNWEV
ncbi:MAG: hypothetical protein NVV82_16625 [Sporocytophaga sp.]|nr:hypothetical protein [Sporocytophaga sp.]